MRDRILSTVLPGIQAGACVPDHGCCCGGPWILQVGCFGACVTSSSCTPATNQRCQ